jgi:hypothetical protein
LLHAYPPRCCCHRFVNFLNAADAISAKQRLHGARLPSGHKLHVTLQTPRTVNAPGANANIHTHLIPAPSNVGSLLQQQQQQQQQPPIAAHMTTQAPAGALALHTMLSLSEQGHKHFFVMQ